MTTLAADTPQPPLPGHLPLFRLALALSLGAAVSLGITRFAYALLLPAMRADMGWSYTLAGAMNTANALGYLLGALVTPLLMRRIAPTRLLVGGSVLASVFMALSGVSVDAGFLLLQRLLAGLASAFVFIAGGLLAARLAAQQPARGGLLLGLYYGGTGLGIVASALAVPAVLQAAASQPHGWVWAWWALALACGLATAVLIWPARVLQHLPPPAVTAQAPTPAERRAFAWRDFAWGLSGYFMFGVGYIGYMTFVIALLRDQGASAPMVTLFYAALGVAVLLSSRLWAGLLDRYRGGQPLALLTALAGLACLLPVLGAGGAIALASGVLFGGVFLSVVASTTALVRHNLPPSGWTAGISAFTVVFAFGQIVGPTIVGWIADGPGGLAKGLLFSTGALWLGAALAWRQRAL